MKHPQLSIHQRKGEDTILTSKGEGFCLPNVNLFSGFTTNSLRYKYGQIVLCKKNWHQVSFQDLSGASSVADFIVLSLDFRVLDV